MVRTSFALGRAGWTLDADDGALLAPLRRLLPGLERPVADGDAVSWRIRHGAPDPTTGGALIYDGPLPFSGLPVILAQEGDVLTLACAGRVRMDAARARHSGTVTVAPGCADLLAGEVGVLILEAALAMSGQSLVHAALLALPGAERGVLLAAPSGAGKTTTALALARQGFALLSDDGAVIAECCGRMEAWGLPRQPKVHRRTAALLPWLSPGLAGTWDASGEQPLDLARIDGLACLSPGRVLPIAGLVWLGGRRAGGSHVGPMPRPDFLAGFAADNLRQGVAGVPEHQIRRFEAIGDLVRRLPTFCLEVGETLEDVGAALATAFAEMPTSAGAP